ncbi:TatD family hydrolase [Planosporangium thailandense]|uniref:TatD family hydrolase n=1 Tax=Planosporangium thailandense TaxID=765197 RepID=A0ABX0XTT9_9ACTN|nr:TatD family hydrolase [Planosporangium thailandense]NJC69411.1 TatD family hydrolase [Planosporangium thailandense]
MLAGVSNDSPSESRKDRAARRAGEFPPPPAPLPTPVIDSHTHLDITLTEGGTGGPDSVEAAIALARDAGVDRLVQVGVDVDSSRWGVEVAHTHSAVVAIVALHPNEAPLLADLDGALREIEALAADPRVRGIGETGLDTFRTGSGGRAAQEASFRAHIAIAKRYGKPLVIHDRDAHADVLRVLDSEGAPETVVLHCFSGDVEFARECVRRGYVLSFAGTVTFGNAGNLREAATVTPTDQLLVETDAPYLTPTPHRGRPNASYLIPLTVRALAEVKNVDLDELCAAISATGDRIFGPWLS